MLEAKKVIKQILFIYLTTTGIFLSIFFTLWYQKLYEELLVTYNTYLRENHRNIVINILNSRFLPIKESAANIAQSTDLKFAILDKDKILFSNIDIKLNEIKVQFKGKGIYHDKVFLLAPMSFDAYYLKQNKVKTQSENALMIFIQGNDVSKELFLIKTKVLSYALLAFLILALIAYFLVKIALKPLEEKIHTLNRFIKDATHEINTPLSVILMSIEQLEKQNIEQSAKFTRIKIAAKTLHQVYSDLVFYNFPNTISDEKEKIILKNLIIERLEYFQLFFEQKKITLESNLDEDAYIFANKYQISKIFDNLLSNAIKYNKKEGLIKLELFKNSLAITDSGCGISKENMKRIFERYARFNQDQGGFGIGLSLVQKICKDNKITLSCDSIENQGSTFKLEWSA